VTVSISGSLSLSVNTTTYAFGSLGVDVGSIAASAIAVTNNSTAFRETYSLSAAATSAPDNWNLSAAPGSNAFVLAATFSSGMPGGSFADGNHRLTSSAQACNGTLFNGGTGQTDCSAVTIGTALNMWFEMVTPTQITGGSGPDTATVYISAAAG
jgi:hypothetical protein